MDFLPNCKDLGRAEILTPTPVWPFYYNLSLLHYYYYILNIIIINKVNDLLVGIKKSSCHKVSPAIRKIRCAIVIAMSGLKRERQLHSHSANSTVDDL